MTLPNEVEVQEWRTKEAKEEGHPMAWKFFKKLQNLCKSPRVRASAKGRRYLHASWGESRRSEFAKESAS